MADVMQVLLGPRDAQALGAPAQDSDPGAGKAFFAELAQQLGPAGDRLRDASAAAPWSARLPLAGKVLPPEPAAASRNLQTSPPTLLAPGDLQLQAGMLFHGDVDLPAPMLLAPGELESLPSSLLTASDPEVVARAMLVQGDAQLDIDDGGMSGEAHEPGLEHVIGPEAQSAEPLMVLTTAEREQRQLSRASALERGAVPAAGAAERHAPVPAPEVLARVAVEKGVQAAPPTEPTGKGPAPQTPLAELATVSTGNPQATEPGTARAQPVLSLDTAAVPGQRAWGESLASRVVWMAGNGLQGAEIRVNPPHLGPIEVRISINQDQASVAFVAQHGATREAIEAAFPRLREMLAEQGLDLVNVEVSQHAPGDREQHARASAGAHSGDGTLGEDGEALAASPARARAGLIDDYA